MKIALTANHCITPLARLSPALVLIEDGVIRQVVGREESPIPGGYTEIALGAHVLAPGYVDIHIHGGAGHDVMEATRGALEQIERHLAGTGVTSYVPTTVTAAEDATLRALEGLGKAIEAEAADGRARPVGIHLEGPFISHAKRGVHSPEHLKEPSVALFARFYEAARGHVRLMTVAPELSHADELIREATRRGVTVSLGHSNATLAETRSGVRAGARHATHTFNAMRALDHREPGILGAVLADRELSAEIIADGIHVAPEVVKLFLQLKGADRAVLVTDAISATGMQDGEYKLGHSTVVVKDGVASFEGRLAGSVLTLDQAVRNAMRVAGWELEASVRLASANAAAVIRLDDAGVIKPGARADFVVLDAAGHVVNTIIAGKLLN